MAERVLTLGGEVNPDTIEGQLCLAPLPYDYDALLPSEQITARAWIFENKNDPLLYPTPSSAGVGSDTDYPVGLTLDHLMELYWRWRTLDIDFEFTYDDFETSNPITVDGSRSGSRSGLTFEYDMVLPSPWEIDQTEFPPSGYVGQYVMDWIMDVFIVPDTPTDKRVIYHDDKYWPSMYIETDFFGVADTGLGLYAGIFKAQSISDASTPNPFNATMTFSGGTTYTLPLFTSDLSSPNVQGLTIDYSATLYWEHAKPDGTAKYNTATGAKL